MSKLTETGVLFKNEEEAKKITEKSTFSPWHVLRKIDLLEVGGLNITGAEIYWQVQNLEKYERVFFMFKNTNCQCCC